MTRTTHSRAATDVSTLRVADVMQTEVFTLSPGMTASAAVRTLTRLGIGGAPVVDTSERPVGLVSLSDLAAAWPGLVETEDVTRPPRKGGPGGRFRTVPRDPTLGGRLLPAGPATRSARGPVEPRVSDLMTPITMSVRPDTTVGELSRLFVRARIHRALVTENGKHLGIVTQTDVVRAIPAPRRPASSERSVEKDDASIATAVLRALDANTALPDDAFRVSVRSGRVVLEGRVDWRFQRQTAEQTVRGVPGVLGVANRIDVVQHTGDLPERIAAALLKGGSTLARVSPEANGGRVVLTGEVPRRTDRDAAGRAAWSTAGVNDVDNRVVIRPPPPE